MRARQVLSRFVPMISWLPECSSKTARTDILAGLALARLLIQKKWPMRASPE